MSNNYELWKAIDRACQYARALEEREKQDYKYGMLIFLLAISIAGLIVLCIRRFA